MIRRHLLDINTPFDKKGKIIQNSCSNYTRSERLEKISKQIIRRYRERERDDDSSSFRVTWICHVRQDGLDGREWRGI